MPHHNSINPDSDSPTQQSLSDGEEHMDRLQQAELTRNTRMSLWKAGAVQAWLEVVMGMSMYTRACTENVKSGKVNKPVVQMILFPFVASEWATILEY